MVTHHLQVERRMGSLPAKDRRSTTLNQPCCPVQTKWWWWWCHWPKTSRFL